MERTFVKYCKNKVGTKHHTSAVFSFGLHLLRANRLLTAL